MEDKGRLWLFSNKNKNRDAQPDLTGSGEVSAKVLRELLDNVGNDPDKDDDIVALQCAAWKKVSKAGRSYYFVTFNVDNYNKNGSVDSTDQNSSRDFNDERNDSNNNMDDDTEIDFP